MAAAIVEAEASAVLKQVLKFTNVKKLRKPTWKLPPCVIVACGSFSPPTYLHLRLFEEARTSLTAKYDVIGGLISPVHDEYGRLYKESLQQANSEERVAMVELATASSEWLGCSQWECTVPMAWTRTAVVLKSIHSVLNDRELCTQLWGEHSPVSAEIAVKFLCGADLLDSVQIPGLWNPEHVQYILSHGIVCCTREGTDEQETVRKHEVLRKHKDKIDFFSVSVKNDISSTIVRKLIGEGKSVKYLTPDSVIAYINEHELYRL